ncbi:MAG: AAA family ATPase [Patescibacteria group bacterium]|jgi:predicted ATP-dependent endonuclease of OLD family
MKITSVSISNILSFPHKEAFSTPTITFQGERSGGSQHILIGPNGSGKSNFIEIINQIFQRVLFQPIVFNESSLNQFKRTGNKNGLGQTIQTPQKSPTSYIEKNYYSTQMDKKVIIEIELSDKDQENIIFLGHNIEQINEMIDRYGSSGTPVIHKFSTSFDLNELAKIHKLELTIEDNSPTNTYTVNVNGNTPEKQLASEYLQFFKLLKRLIYIHNSYEIGERGTSWKEINENFVLLGSYRNYHSFNESVDVNPDPEAQFRALDERRLNENTKSGDNNEPAVMELVRRKVANEYHRLIHNPEATVKKAPELIKSFPLLKKINEKLNSFLGITLEITDPEYRDLSYEMFFSDNNAGGQRVNFSGLSSGQKSIVHLIFTLFGYDLDNGSIIIDEPELHLHPQMQQKYLKLIKELKEEKNIQFVIATHSPIFVNSETIKDTYRFFMDQKETKIINPKITSSEYELIKILDYTNSSKIFFSEKAILVEGESDEFFYRYFIEEYLKTEFPSLQSQQLKTYEVFNISGKGSSKRWRKFLEDFKVDVSFVADWDNIANFKIENVQEMANLTSKTQTDYCGITEELIKNHNVKFSEISSAIDSLKASKNYILKLGSLECYLGLSGKEKVEEVIDFCHTRFLSWKIEPVYENKRLELENIFKGILV